MLKVKASNLVFVKLSYSNLTFNMKVTLWVCKTQ